MSTWPSSRKEAVLTSQHIGHGFAEVGLARDTRGLSCQPGKELIDQRAGQGLADRPAMIGILNLGYRLRSSLGLRPSRSSTASASTWEERWKSMPNARTATPVSRSAETSCASNTSSAISSNAHTLVSIGGVQSNHTRMVAAVAAKIGMKCLLVQESWVPHEDAVYDRVGNIVLSRIMGAEVRMVDEGFDIGIRRSLKKRSMR